MPPCRWLDRHTASPRGAALPGLHPPELLTARRRRGLSQRDGSTEVPKPPQPQPMQVRYLCGACVSVSSGWGDSAVLHRFALSSHCVYDACSSTVGVWIRDIVAGDVVVAHDAGQPYRV